MFQWLVQDPSLRYLPSYQNPQFMSCIHQIQATLMKQIRLKIPSQSKIQRFSTKKIDFQRYQLSVFLQSYYKNYFQICILMTIIFQPNLDSKVQIKYIIDSSIPKFIQQLKCLEQTLATLDRLNLSSNRYFQYSIQKNLIMYEKASFKQFTANPICYANHITSKIYFPFQICADILQEIEKKAQQKIKNITTSRKNISQQQKIFQKALKAPQIIDLIQLEQEGFSQYFTREAVQKGLLKTVQEAQQSHKGKRGQITQGIIVTQSQDQKNFKSIPTSLSKVSLKKCKSKFYGTIGLIRQNANIEWQDEMELYTLGERPIIVELVCKQFPEKAEKQLSSLESFRNQYRFLLQKGGYNKSIFLNNYYLEAQGLWSLSDQAIRQKKIYSDYHQMSVYEKFYDPMTRKYTMSDVVNLMQQVMTALIQSFLWNGFLNRDVKDQNTLIEMKNGIVKLIDFASVFPFNLPPNQTVLDQYFNPVQMEAQRRKYHPTLRSTLYVNRKLFQKHKDDEELKEYKKDFNLYKKCADAHSTFDVYSVGQMLKNMIENYFKDHPQCDEWGEVKGRWQKLISRMVVMDPLKRIPMDEALKQIKEIRRFIFGKT